MLEKYLYHSSLTQKMYGQFGRWEYDDTNDKNDITHSRFYFAGALDTCQFFVQQTLAEYEIRMRKVGDGFQHDLDRDVQIVFVMKLIDLQYGEVGFEIVRVFLGLRFYVVFERGQVLGIVSEWGEKSRMKTRIRWNIIARGRDERPELHTSRCPVKGTQQFVSLLRPWFMCRYSNERRLTSSLINGWNTEMRRLTESYDFCFVFNNKN